MSDTIECKTCGGSGTTGMKLDDPPYAEPRLARCPDCVNGRQPTPNLVDRMSNGLFPYEVRVALRHNWTEDGIKLIERQVARAAWLAEWRNVT
jgi:hypothetical protein